MVRPRLNKQNEHAAGQRNDGTHFSRLQHGRHLVAGVERRNELALIGESAEGGDALDVGGGDLQESSRPPVSALAELLQRAGFVRGGGRQAVKENGGALDVHMRHLRQRLVQTSEHDAGDAGQLVQRVAQQFGEGAPALHLRGVAGADGGVEDEKHGVFASAAVGAGVHGVDRDALRFKERDAVLRAHSLNVRRHDDAGGGLEHGGKHGGEGAVGLGRQRLHAVLEAGEQVDRRGSVEWVQGERLAGLCGRVHGDETAERFAG
jgi:hypothetical protein